MMTTNQIDVLRKPDPSKFFLKWNDFESQILTGFSQLYVSKSLADVTLVCEGTSIKAHKLVLSMYSPYLRMILTVKKYIRRFIILLLPRTSLS